MKNNNNLNKYIKNIAGHLKNKWVIVGIVIFATVLAIIINFSLSDPLDNDVEVEFDSELTYYLNVSYDGVDRNGLASDDSTISDVKSGTIYVEDRLPDGLTFDRFLTTADGSFGSIQRTTGSSCLGKVVDDTNEESPDEGVWNAGHTEYTYHGLHYSTLTNKVTFKVSNLQAGCVLTVGIVTRTPSTADDPSTEEVETRRDFYNFATAREKGLTATSNTVHAFMGSDKVSLVNVEYEYDTVGEVPANAPNLPDMQAYAPGTIVSVAPDLEVEGYTFTGWKTSDVQVTNGTFEVPGGDVRTVTFSGSFERKAKYTVTYQITGDVPEEYVVPLQKEYYEGAEVVRDSLRKGTVLNGARFDGWSSEDVELPTEDVNKPEEKLTFAMPDHNVTITGNFIELKYDVEYRFFDGVLPPNADDYLPPKESHKPGDEVTLKNIETEPDGYEFLTWYYDPVFEMPEHNVIVYGEWKEKSGEFEPVISKEVISGKDYYRYRDNVEYKITITNNEDYAISKVMITEDNDNSIIQPDSGYTKVSDHMAVIETIPAHSSKYVYATYTVQATDSGTVVRDSSLIGALGGSPGNYELKPGTYIASASFVTQAKLTICQRITGTYNENTFQFHITGNTSNYETWMALDKDECETIFIDPTTYNINQIAPQEYSLVSVTGAITSNNANLVVSPGEEYTIEFTNSFIKKGFLHSFGRVRNIIVQGGA